MPIHNVMMPASGSAMSITAKTRGLESAVENPLRQRRDEGDDEEAGPDVGQDHSRVL
jgi:hypothetical protein